MDETITRSASREAGRRCQREHVRLEGEAFAWNVDLGMTFAPSWIRASCGGYLNLMPDARFLILDERGIEAKSPCAARTPWSVIMNCWMFLALLAVDADWKIGEIGVYRPLDVSEVAVADDGAVYISRQAECDVLMFDDQGRQIGRFGRRGQGPGEFQVPMSVHVDDGHVYVLDIQLNAVNVFGRDGEFEKRLDLPMRNAEYLKTMHGWAYGNWQFTLDPNQPVQLFLCDRDLACQDLLASWPRSGSGPGVVVIRSDGSGTPEIPFNPASHQVLAASSRDGGRLFVAARESFEIQMFDTHAGRELAPIVQKMDPIPFNASWGEERLEAMQSRDQGIPARFVADFPKYFPVIRRLWTTPEGDLVVELWAGRPDKDERFMVFDASGQPKSLTHPREKATRWVAVRHHKAYVTGYDPESEEAFLWCGARDGLDEVLEATPIPDDAPSRQVQITIGG